MLVYVKVKTRSNKQEVVKFGDNRYLIYLKSEPENNEANIELVNLLSKYFTTSYKNIKFKSGMQSDNKVLEIL